MHIAFVGQKGIPAISGGVERYVEEVSVRLATHGHTVSVYTRRPYLLAPIYKGVHCIPTSYVDTKQLGAITHTLSAMRHILRHAAPDIVHINSVGPGLLMPFLKGALFLKHLFVAAPRPRLVFTFHSPDWEHGKWGFVARRALKVGAWCARKSADRVVYVSENLLARFGGRNRDVHIPNGTAMKKAEDRDRLRELHLERPYIFYAGRLVEHKNVHILIQAFRESSLGDTYTLVIAGDHAGTPHYKDRLRALAEGVDVRFLGNQTGETLRQLFSHAAMYVLPSSSEGLSVSLLEATGMGIPTVVSDLAQNREIVGDSAQVITPGSCLELRVALEDIHQRYAVWQNTATALQPRIEGEYSWKSVTDRLERLYAEVRPTDSLDVTEYSYAS